MSFCARRTKCSCACAGRRRPLGDVVEEDHVEIAAVGELAAWRACPCRRRGTRPPAGSRRAAPASRRASVERRLDADLGEVGEPGVGLLGRDLLGEIEQADVDQLAVVEQAQRVELALASSRRCPREPDRADLGERRAQRVARQQQHVRVAEDRLDQARVRRQVAGEVLGGGEQAGQPVDQLGPVEQQAVVEAARPDAADEAVEVVHRPLRIGRRLDRAREVGRELLDLAARRRLGEQVRSAALEEVEQPLRRRLRRTGSRRTGAHACGGARSSARVEGVGARRPPRTAHARAPGARAPRASPGRRCVWRSPSICSAVLGAAQESVGARAAPRTARAGRTPTCASAVSARWVERSRTCGMRPPCSSCSACATNSTSRMPPAPILTLNAAPLRPVGLLDLLLHRLDGGDAGVVHRRAVDHRIDGADRLPAEGEVAGHRARLHERRLLPGRRPGVVVVRQHRRSARPAGPAWPSGRRSRSMR